MTDTTESGAADSQRLHQSQGGAAPAKATKKREITPPRRGTAPAALEKLTDEHWAIWLEHAWPKPHQPFFLLFTEAFKAWAGHHARSCGACDHVKLHGDPRRGWCKAQRRMVGQTFPILCKDYR